MANARPRVAISLNSSLLVNALVEVLVRTGVDDVVELGTASDRERSQRFDAAVVWPVLPAGITAGCVIELPDGVGNGGAASVAVDGRTDIVSIDGVGDILDLLDRYCPGTRQRSRAPPS